MSSASTDSSASGSSANSPASAITISAAAAALSGSDRNGPTTCSANALDTGDGWGWEYGAPCQWGAIRPTSTADSTYVPEPIELKPDGYVDGKAICLTDASDGNHDGFGYENNRTCTVVAGRTATAADPLLNQRWWSAPGPRSTTATMCYKTIPGMTAKSIQTIGISVFELGKSGGSYIAKWDYNWLERTEGNEFSVKSYPQVYYGRKTGNTMSGSPEKLGLPAPLNNIPDYRVHFKYSETGSPERNVALESFFSHQLRSGRVQQAI